jgi:hypothetical protein
MWLKNQEASEKRQHDMELLRQEQQPQQSQQPQQDQSGQQQQQNPMDMYNQYTQVMDMMPAAAPAYEAPAMGSTPAATSAFGGASELGGTAGLGAEAGTGIGGYASYAVPVLAAIAGQHLLSGSTDRRTMNGKASSFEGHRTGDVFSGDMFTEPWMAFGEQKLGIKDPTAGEKTDAALNDLREGKGSVSELLSTAPETAFQWFDPFGNFFDDILTDKFGTVGKIASAAILPGTGLKNIAKMIGGLF